MSAGMKIGRQQGTFPPRLFVEVLKLINILKDNVLVAIVTLGIGSPPHSKPMGIVVAFCDRHTAEDSIDSMSTAI